MNKKYYLHIYVTVHTHNFKRNSAITATLPQYLPCQPGGTSHTLGIIGLFDNNSIKLQRALQFSFIGLFNLLVVLLTLQKFCFTVTGWVTDWSVTCHDQFFPPFSSYMSETPVSAIHWPSTPLSPSPFFSRPVVLPNPSACVFETRGGALLLCQQLSSPIQLPSFCSIWGKHFSARTHRLTTTVIHI